MMIADKSRHMSRGTTGTRPILTGVDEVGPSVEAGATACLARRRRQSAEGRRRPAVAWDVGVFRWPAPLPSRVAAIANPPGLFARRLRRRRTRAAASLAGQRRRRAGSVPRMLRWVVLVSGAESWVWSALASLVPHGLVKSVVATLWRRFPRALAASGRRWAAVSGLGRRLSGPALRDIAASWRWPLSEGVGPAANRRRGPAATVRMRVGDATVSIVSASISTVVAVGVPVAFHCDTISKAW